MSESRTQIEESRRWVETVARKRIDVWHDETSDPECPAWVVSIDDEQGSRTLKTFSGEAKARAFALSAAYPRGLDVFMADKFGGRMKIN